MSSRRWRFFVHVILPLLLGGLIYVCLRDSDLRMFQWFDFIGAGPLIARLRITAAPLQNIIPVWIQFSGPNALWAYSLTALMALVWWEAHSRAKFFWLSLGALLGVGTELGQAIDVIPGAFDVTDIALCILAAALALVVTSDLFTRRRRLDDFTT